MYICFSEEQAAIRDGVKRVVDQFGDEYWSACEEEKKFPFKFHKAMANAAWLGITMPEELGGAGLGVIEARS